MPGVRANDDQVWALSVRGAAMALHPCNISQGACSIVCVSVFCLKGLMPWPKR